MTTYTRITGLDDFPAALAVLPAPLTDGRRVAACVHLRTPGTDEIAYAAVYTIDPLTWHATKHGESDPFAKDTAVAFCLNDMTLELYTTEPPPFGGGAENELHVYAFFLGARMVAVDLPARKQAMDATHIGKAALVQIEALASRVGALEG